MSERKKRTWRDGLGFSIGCGVGLVAFYVLLTIGHYYNDGWGPDQWGPVASWVSGLATFFAVGVALFQTKLARDDTAQAMERAAHTLANEEARHQSALAAANQRLTDQFDAQNRAVQVKAVTALIKAYQTQRSCAQTLLKALRVRQRNQAARGAEPLIEAPYARYKDNEDALHRATVDAAFLITDEDTRSTIAQIEVQYEAVDELITRMYGQSLPGTRFVTGLDRELDELLEGLDDLVSTAFATARTNIAKLPSFYDTAAEGRD
ncbi:hypothetical protein HQO42_05335 [Rhodococcus fascians]|nr:hypothetical protein [Rhodococcus fascians]MBY4236572.1 hypothetical protein [Rhodococcus fascians]MBY4252062.1 hypothetical protein [Rhodococcus fascians]MBY4267917.1 hypothetical protein [Rhodococcus fascians]